MAGPFLSGRCLRGIARAHVPVPTKPQDDYSGALVQSCREHIRFEGGGRVTRETELDRDGEVRFMKEI